MEFGWLFSHAAALAGVLSGWFNPLFGLMVYYGFAVIRPVHLWDWNNWPFPRLSLYVALSTLIGWAAGGFGNFAGLRSIRWPIMGLAVYLLAGTAAWQLTEVSPEVAWDFLSIQLKIGLMALVTITLVRNAKSIHTYAYLVTAALGYLAWVFNSSYYFDQWNRVRDRGFGGVDNNGIAMTMVMGVPLAFFIAINSKKWWVKLLCLAAVAMQVHVVLFSFSRGAQLGLVLVGMTIFIIAMLKLPRKGVTIGLAVVFPGFGLYFAGNEVRSRFQSIFLDPEQRDESAQSRFVTWGAAWACMQDHPLGVGPRNFNLLASRYGLPGRKSVHNLFLQTGADYGFIGMFALAAFYFGTMYKTFRMAATETAKRLIWPRYYGHMVCISLGGFLVCSTFIGMESVESSFIISLLGLCTVAHVDRVAQDEPAHQMVPELEQVPSPGEGEPLPA